MLNVLISRVASSLLALLSVVIYILANLIVDLIVAAIDPRIVRSEDGS